MQVTKMTRIKYTGRTHQNMMYVEFESD
jgi:hypothetical protein